MAPDFLTSFAQLGASRFIGAASSSCEFHVELPAELFIEVGLFRMFTICMFTISQLRLCTIPSGMRAGR